MYNLNYYFKNKCDEIPNEPGVYFIKVPDGFTVNILADTIALEIGTSGTKKGKSLLYDKKILEEKYQKVTGKQQGEIDKSTLYIGKANLLKKRITQYLKAGFAKGKSHYGGRAIWQIENCGALLLEFRPMPEHEKKESDFLIEYKRRNGCYPLANWRR